MKLAGLLAIGLLVASSSMYGQERASMTALQGGVWFQPRITVGSPAPPLFARRPAARPPGGWKTHHRPATAIGAAEQNDREIICGLTVIRKHPQSDRKMILKLDRSDPPAIRRIVPPVCASQK